MVSFAAPGYENGCCTMTGSLTPPSRKRARGIESALAPVFDWRSPNPSTGDIRLLGGQPTPRRVASLPAPTRSTPECSWDLHDGPSHGGC
jgi:hypothetical protein